MDTLEEKEVAPGRDILVVGELSDIGKAADMLYPGGGAEACSNETDLSGAVENRLKSSAFLLKKEVRRNDEDLR